MKKRRSKKPQPYRGPLGELIVEKFSFDRLVVGADALLQEMKLHQEALRAKIAREKLKFDAMQP